jgi:hypothetical protein
MQIETIKGMIDREQLVVKDIIEENDNARVTATEWYFGEELVRRDCNINMLRGLSMGGEQGKVN